MLELLKKCLHYDIMKVPNYDLYLNAKNACTGDTIPFFCLRLEFYGFMKERIKTAIEFLDMYLSGELDKLEELEEPRLKSKYFGFDNYQKIAGV